MTRSRVLVVGSSGRVGAPLVRLLGISGAEVWAALPELVPGRTVAAPAKQVRLDLDSPRTWSPALVGVTRVYLVRPSHLRDVRTQLRRFLERVADVGVEHVVFQSVAGVARGMPHADVEDAIDALRLSRTFLRPTTFHQRLSDTYGDLVASHDLLCLPAGRGRTAYVDARDVAEVSASILLDSAPPPRAAYTLTSLDSLTGEQVAALLSEATGRRIRFAPVTLGQYRRQLLATGADLSSVRVQLLLNASARLVLGGATDPTLGELLGRRPTSLASYLHEHRDHWAPV